MDDVGEHPAVAARAEDAGRGHDSHAAELSGRPQIETGAVATDAAALRAAFAGDGATTVGAEEELMLLDPRTLDLAPVAAAAIATGEGRIKAELPAAQVEVASAPCATVAELAAELAAGRRAAARAAAGIALPAAAGAHPFAGPLGTLAAGPRGRRITAEYGDVARLQLISGLHVHVRVTGPERALAVYNALRSYLPELAALAANAPFLAGRDSGMASVRPKVCELLPRQGVPPALASWEEYADALRWGVRSGSFEEPRLWWWELRPHPAFGTLELRVPDQPTTVADSAAVAAVAQSLVAWLAARWDAGEPLAVHPTWRIEQNRWSAARHGVEGVLADLDDGAPRRARVRLRALIDELLPTADRLGCAGGLSRARELVERGGAERQRAAAAGDPRRAAAWLAERFLEGA